MVNYVLLLVSGDFVFGMHYDRYRCWVSKYARQTVPVVLLHTWGAWLMRGNTVGILIIGSYVYHSDVIDTANVK